jgi:hypothetical protein
MYCPKCRGEYIEDIAHCPSCDIPLVTELPPVEQKAPKSYLAPAAALAMAGSLYIFLVRTAWTIFPDVFSHQMTYTLFNGLFVLAALSMLPFSVFFYREYTTDNMPALRAAAIMAIIAISLMALLHLRDFILVADIRIMPEIDRHVIKAYFWHQYIPPVSLALLLMFFAVFHHHLESESPRKLRLAAALAIVGAAAALAFDLFNRYVLRAVVDLQILHAFVAVVFSITMTFSVFTRLYFLSCFLGWSDDDLRERQNM